MLGANQQRLMFDVLGSAHQLYELTKKLVKSKSYRNKYSRVILPVLEFLKVKKYQQRIQRLSQQIWKYLPPAIGLYVYVLE